MPQSRFRERNWAITESKGPAKVDKATRTTALATTALASGDDRIQSTQFWLQQAIYAGTLPTIVLSSVFSLCLAMVIKENLVEISWHSLGILCRYFRKSFRRLFYSSFLFSFSILHWYSPNFLFFNCQFLWLLILIFFHYSVNFQLDIICFHTVLNMRMKEIHINNWRSHGKTYDNLDDFM